MYFCVNAFGTLLPIYIVFMIQVSKYRRSISAILEARREQLLLQEKTDCEDEDDFDVVSNQEIEGGEDGARDT